MKAGIYQSTEYGTLYYVGKDRTVMASTPNGGFAVGTKVTTQRLEQWAKLGSLELRRVSDVPNGCKDHARALLDYATRQNAVESTEMSDYKESVKDVQYVSTRDELQKHSAERQQRMLATHPPAVQTEQPATDSNNSKPATPDFAERAQAQVDTVVAYEKAKRDLQLMLLCEQSGVVQWTGDDWEILDNDAWNLTQIAPTKLLPVLPRGWVAERAAAYSGNARANSPLDRGLKQAMAVVLGNEPRFHTGGYAGKGPEGVVPAVLDTCVMRGRSVGKSEAPATPEWASNLPAGAANFAKSVEIYHIEKHARHIGDAFRMQFQQLSHSFEAWRDYEFRMVLAHIVEAAHVYHDEVTILDPIRFDNLEQDTREGRYENLGTHVIDTDTFKEYPVSVEQRAIIKHLLDAKPNYIVASGSADPIPAELHGRRYWTVSPERAQALAKLKKGERMSDEDWSHVSDDPYERVALSAIARGEVRLIGKQSKRKHKRAGHQVFWCAAMDSWAWRVRE